MAVCKLSRAYVAAGNTSFAERQALLQGNAEAKPNASHFVLHNEATRRREGRARTHYKFGSSHAAAKTIAEDVMRILGALFGWVPDIIGEWGLYGVLLAIVGVCTEVGFIGALLALVAGALSGGLEYLKRTGGAFSRGSEERWDLLGYGLGVIAAVAVMGLVIGPAGWSDAGSPGFVWGSWVLALAGGAVAFVGMVVRDAGTRSSALRLVGSALFAAGLALAALYLFKGAVEVSQTAIVF